MKYLSLNFVTFLFVLLFCHSKISYAQLPTDCTEQKMKAAQDEIVQKQNELKNYAKACKNSKKFDGTSQKALNKLNKLMEKNVDNKTTEGYYQCFNNSTTLDPVTNEKYKSVPSNLNPLSYSADILSCKVAKKKTKRVDKVRVVTYSGNYNFERLKRELSGVKSPVGRSVEICKKSTELVTAFETKSKDYNKYTAYCQNVNTIYFGAQSVRQGQSIDTVYDGETLYVKVGDAVRYAWNLGPVASASSTYSVDTDTCGGTTGAKSGSWVINTISGKTDGNIDPCQKGGTYTLTAKPNVGNALVIKVKVE
jgi:hypothetical protein